VTAKTYNIGELADAAGITRRTVRFYVQQNLLPAPNGVGRGDHYDDSHLAALRKIAQLQDASHSLAAIRQLLASNQPLPAPAVQPAPQPTPESDPLITTFTRITLAPGVELQIDSIHHPALTPETLAQLRNLARRTLGFQD
jgi:DNA-binding transcriptional MerR regulator